MSRWNWKKPQWPTIAPSDFRSTAHGPMPSIAHMPTPDISAPPAVLADHRLAADVAHDLLVGERRRIVVEVARAKLAQDQPFGLDPRRFAGSFAGSRIRSG